MRNQKELFLGIELGSTRIKSVIIDKNAEIVAKGGFEWKNILADGLWSYPLDEAVRGLRESYRELAGNYEAKEGEKLREFGCIGISAMMHGYIVLDSEDNLLAPFRTWRNTNTHEAATELSSLFNFNIPMRWSVAQYYQSVLDGLDHIPKVKYLTTLAGYIHYLLTGEKVLGINDASGMFPVEGRSYSPQMMQKFNKLISEKGIDTDFETLLPKVLVAGEKAGVLTEQGAKLLDVSGNLKSGCIFCPPEGDMGTGSVATNSVGERTSNVSAGTSANLTVVLEKPLENYYPEIDILSAPNGKPCALIHTNNCTTEMDEWANMFGEMLALFGVEASKGKILDTMFAESEKCDEDLGKTVTYNFLAGEPMAGTEKGFPMTGRFPDGSLTLANFSKSQIYSAISTLTLGMEMLKKENVKIDKVLGHGGYYKAENIGQIATSAALGGVPVTVAKTAGEGGAWGMALLALYMVNTDKTLPEFLDGIFAGMDSVTLCADETEMKKYTHYFENYKKCMPLQKLGSKLQ